MSEFSIDYKKLLQGYYEAELLPKDFSVNSSVPDFAFNVLNPIGLLYRPVVDEYFLNSGNKKPFWPEGKTFAVCLTHDIDAVSLYCLRQWLRDRKIKLSVRNSFFQKARGFTGLCIDLMRREMNWFKKDPIHRYESWLEIEKKFDAHSTFFCWPGWSSVAKHHDTDCTYELNDKVVFDGQRCTVKEMIQEIDYRGWEIGLHPSWYSFNNVEELKRQKDALEKILNHDIFSVRQHYLRYDIRITPRVHSQAGFKYDSTLGFNDNVGFRFGTCYPWYLYDIKAQKKLSIMEIPLIAQDGAMLKQFKGLRLDSDRAFQYIVQLTEAVEKVGGVLTLLWHPSTVQNLIYWDLYKRVLNYLNEKNPWFGTIREIGEWWQKINIARLNVIENHVSAIAYTI